MKHTSALKRYSKCLVALHLDYEENYKKTKLNLTVGQLFKNTAVCRKAKHCSSIPLNFKAKNRKNIHFDLSKQNR